MARTRGYTRSQSQCSTGSSGSGDAPTSVMLVPASPLSRELSDLSGSYMNGNTAPRRRLNSGSSSHCGVPTSICSNTETSVQGPWRQAHVLSSVPPRDNSWQTAIVVERNGVIELVKNNNDEDESDSDDRGFSGQNGNEGATEGASSSDQTLFSHGKSSAPTSTRIPLIILLMDPARKHYELMRLWVDTEMDTVRDVLHTLQQKLSDKWRQDYDGLFQVRGNQYCQLVHILNISKYDIHPRELWVAKPWSMAAKTTTEYADDCIRQLRAGGLLTPHTNSAPKRRKNFFSGRTSPMVPDDDAPLTLSEEALKRVYVPGGTLKHHHACQFLSFRVPRASPMDPYMVGHHRAIQQHSYHGKPARSKDGFLGMSSLLGASSFDDTSSQLSNPSDVMLLAHSTSEGAFIKASSSSSFATPPRAIRAQQQSPPYGRPSQPQQSMILNTASFRKWGAQASPPLATVGEAGNNTMKENPTETASLKDPSLTKKPKESRNKKRSLLVKWMGLMSCLIGRHKVGGSEKSRDGYSSSWGGDGSKSSDAKIQLTNTGRDTPDSDTSKGSAEAGEAEDTFFVDSSIEVGSGGLIQNTNWARFGDDPSVVTPSVVSDSAPLLTNFSRNSSSSVVN